MYALAHNETEIYQQGLIDKIDGRESLASTLAMVGRSDLLINYVRGWLVGERLLAGVNPLGGIDEDDGAC